MEIRSCAGYSRASMFSVWGRNRRCAVYVRVSLQHLRWAVLQRAAERVEERARLQHGRRAKINQFDMKLCVYDDVLVFYVPV